MLMMILRTFVGNGCSFRTGVCSTNNGAEGIFDIFTNIIRQSFTNGCYKGGRDIEFAALLIIT
mgnify:CR=1 FL=1